MMKANKKRRRVEKAVPGIHRLDGLVNIVIGNAERASSTLEDCLGEFEQPATAIAVAIPTTTTTATTVTAKDSASNNNNNACIVSGLTMAGSGSQLLNIPSLRTRLLDWNTNFLAWQETGRYTPGLLPSFDLEMARHFKVKELSTYLLEDACPGLRMPALERWLVDCKVEEETTRRTPATTWMDDEDGAAASRDHYPVPKKRKRQSGRHVPDTIMAAGSDPVLASNPQPFQASRRLEQEVAQCLVTAQGSDDNCDEANEKAKMIVKELCRRTITAVQELVQKQRSSLDHAPLHKGDKIILEKGKDRDKDKNSKNNDCKTISLIYHRKRWKQPFLIRLNQSHYHKLVATFEQTHGMCISAAAGKRATIHAFHVLVMTLVLRYSSWSGGQLLNDLRGGGMQGAIHEQVFVFLQQHHHRHLKAASDDVLLLEAFASPWNHACTNYASAFCRDLDFHFGALGSFFDLGSILFLDKLQNQNWICELNPPYAPSLMNCMVEHVEEWLEVAESNQRSLSFVLIVPTVSSDDTGSMPLAQQFARPSFQAMILSSYCSRHIVLKAKSHGYVEGAQHLRPTRYKESAYDTSVFLLQTSRARQAINNFTDFDSGIRTAFASRHAEELTSRRQATNNNDG